MGIKMVTLKAKFIFYLDHSLWFLAAKWFLLFRS